MNFTRTMAAAVASVAITFMAGAASAQTTVLKYSNWLPVGQAMRVQAVEPWIAEVEKVVRPAIRRA